MEWLSVRVKSIVDCPRGFGAGWKRQIINYPSRKNEKKLKTNAHTEEYIIYYVHWTCYHVGRIQSLFHVWSMLFNGLPTLGKVNKYIYNILRSLMGYVFGFFFFEMSMWLLYNIIINAPFCSVLTSHCLLMLELLFSSYIVFVF